jgi:acetyltransferase-like isoleucine patch superfamily enzyme
LGRATLDFYRFVRRAYAKAFSLGIGGAFASFGARSVIEPPVRLSGERGIAIGNDVFIGADSWLQTHEAKGVVLEIGDATSIAGHCVLSAARSIRVGRRVLLARGVYVADHTHAYDDMRRAVLEQGITRVEPVEIGDGAWLGENVVIGPGVSIGRGAVIGANAVVLDDVPSFAVAVGAPARVVKTFGSSAS